MEHKTDWKLKDTVTPGDMNRIEGNIKELETPSFNDSGTVSDINSFTDFVNSVKSKMSIFDFFKNFKAGMKYVLHTGRLANNVTTTQEGFALDARMGKTLQDQITDVNKNIQQNTFLLSGGTFIDRDSDLNILMEIGNYYCNSNEYAQTLLNCPTKEAFTLKISSSTGIRDNPYRIQELTTFTGKKHIRIYDGYLKQWSEWDSSVVNSDLIAKQYKATLLNGWTQPFGDNHLITYKIGNLYMLSGVIRSPSIITEDTYNVANLNLPFNFTGQGCVNMAVQTDDKLYLTSYNDGILHDQYRQVVANTEYMIKGFFIY